MKLTLAAFLCAVPVFAQTTPAFEVASIRPSAPGAPQAAQIGLKLDGQQARFVGLSVRDYVVMAFRVMTHQVVGPDWMGTTRFDISATLPEGVPTSQIPEMVQSLLKERYQLKFHREKKELPVYALVQGKPPLRLTESTPDGKEPPTSVTIAGSGSSAGVGVNLGNGSYFSMTPGHFEARKIGLDQLADTLARFVDRPVLNLTGLKGSYDFDLPLTDEDYRAMLVRSAINAGVVLPPQAMRALETGSIGSVQDAFEKLGLKLEARKELQDVIIVDEILKTPTDN